MGHSGATVDVQEDWKEKKAQKIVDALLKAKIGQGLAKDPDASDCFSASDAQPKPASRVGQGMVS